MINSALDYGRGNWDGEALANSGGRSNKLGNGMG